MLAIGFDGTRADSVEFRFDERDARASIASGLPTAASHFTCLFARLYFNLDVGDDGRGRRRRDERMYLYPHTSSDSVW